MGHTTQQLLIFNSAGSFNQLVGLRPPRWLNKKSLIEQINSYNIENRQK